MVKMLDETFGLQRAMMTTVHAYTADQPLADVAGADLRRSRSAVDAVKVTVSSEKAAKDAYINTAIKQNNEPEDCETCSA